MMTETEIQAQINELKPQRKGVPSDSPEDIELQQELRELEEQLAKLEAEKSADPSPAVPPPMPEDRAARALHRTYLLHLLETVGRLELSGIDRKAVGQSSETCLNLATIYTALLTRSTDTGFGKEQGGRGDNSRPWISSTGTNISSCSATPEAAKAPLSNFWPSVWPGNCCKIPAPT